MLNMINKKIDIATNKEVVVYKGYKITCPQCRSNKLFVYPDMINPYEMRATCKSCKLDFNIEAVFE